MNPTEKKLMPLESLTPDKIRGVKGIFFDIDDTFSLDGKIPACSFKALWDLQQAGFRTIPVTGRPAGWCDHIARMWPVDAVIGENGSMYFWMDRAKGKLERYFSDPGPRRREKRRRLKTLGEKILSTVKGTALASDQAYRETDLAVDFCEDVPPLGDEAIAEIIRLFHEAGATCKASSIHVNGWFGDYDKLKMTRKFVQQQLHVSLTEERDHFVYCGDSPNDEPMFQFFPLSVGVSNVMNFTDRMTHLPAYVTSEPGGKGFAQLANRLLQYRR